MSYQISINNDTLMASVNGKAFDYWPTMTADTMADRISGDYFESLPVSDQPSEFSQERVRLQGQVLQAIIDNGRRK